MKRTILKHTAAYLLSVLTIAAVFSACGDQASGDSTVDTAAKTNTEKLQIDTESWERAKEMASEMANKKSKEIALALISLGEDTFEKIAKVTALSLEEVNELAGSRTAS